MKDLFIIGAGGFGREVLWLVQRINEISSTWNIKGFIDDDETLKNKILNGYKVYGTINDLNKLKDIYCVCAIGNPQVRSKIISNISKNVSFAVLIDPSVITSQLINIGEGTVICAGSILTVNISIGQHCIINLDCTIGHDVVLNDYSTLYPSTNVSGNVIVKEKTLIGTGSKIIQDVIVGKESILGAGAVVNKNIPDYCTAVGCPAKPIKFFR